MDSRPPHNGPLSGMIITAGAALVIPAIWFVPGLRSRFDVPLGNELTMLFFIGAMLMAIHKTESYLSREYDVCPVYHTQGSAWGAEPRRAIFLSFATTFIGMLLLLALALFGPPWPLAIVMIWIAQGLHEVHHAAKSLARRRMYPGLVTSIAFVALQWALLYPRWYELVVGDLDTSFALSYALLPIAFVLFYFEDRKWIVRSPRWAWDPPRREEVLVARAPRGAAE